MNQKSKKVNPKNAEFKEVFNSLDEAARFVGLSRPTFTREVLPHVAHRRAGHRHLISRRVLLEWLERQDEMVATS